MASGSSAATAPLARAGRFLGDHPFVAMALLTPGIPEYLLGSSPVAWLVVSPPLFVVNLLVNLGIYTASVLLIREALVRWQKGWPSLLLLGAAFTIVEEGLGAATFFSPSPGGIAVLGLYGHALGVNWVDVVGISIYHTVVSVAVPLAIFETAFPERRGRPLLTRRSALALGAAVATATAVLGGLIVPASRHFSTPLALVGASLLALVLLVLAARQAPPWPWVRRERPVSSLRQMFLLGLAFVPATLAAEYLPIFLGVHPIVTAAIDLAVASALLGRVLRSVGAAGLDRQRLSLAAGTCAGVAAFGAVLQLPSPAFLLPSLLAALGLWALDRRLREAVATDPAG